jgi:hypothetical protein
MSVSRAEADAELAAVEDVTRRVKQSRIYRFTGRITIFWGVLQFVQYAFERAMPAATTAWNWALIDALGVAVTVIWISRRPRRSGVAVRRMASAFALFYGFGLLWAELGGFGGREASLFWRSLFLFGYSLAGIWFGYGFLALGVGLTGAMVAVYLFAGVWFSPLIVLVSGTGYILCGLWMLRA